MMAENCWRGRDDPTPYTPGYPEEVPRTASLAELFSIMECCTRCELAEGRTQVVTGAGPGDARVVFIGEAPGAMEDREGRPFVGRAGQILDQLLERVGIRRDEVFITNIVSCRPPRNRDPRVGEIRAHSPWLEEQLRIIEPEVIVTLGRIALTYFIPKARISELHGTPRTIERSGKSIQLLPLFHPAAALRRPELIPVLEEDLGQLPPLLSRTTRGPSTG